MYKKKLISILLISFLLLPGCFESAVEKDSDVFFGIDIDRTFSISNNDITIRSDLIIGDNSCNDRRYDLGSVTIASGVLDTLSNFNLYNYNN